MNLSKGIKVTVVEGAAVAGTSALTSDVLDMSGFEGVLWIALTGDATSGSVLTFTAKGNSANSVSSPTPVTQTSCTYTATGASDADSKAMLLDVYKPTLRYQFCIFAPTIQNCVLGGILGIQYEAGCRPTTQDATVIASAFALGVTS